MYSARLRLPYLLCVVPAVLLFAALKRGMFLYGDSSFLAFRDLPLGRFFPLVHFSTNSFLSWRFEPTLHLLCMRVGFECYLSAVVLLGTWGVAAATREYAQCGALRSSLLAVAVTSLLLHWFGADLIVWSFVAALGWQLFFFSRFGKPGRSGALVLALVTFSCGALANSLVLLTTVIAAAVHLRKMNSRSLAIALVIAAGYSLFLPKPPFPNYPSPGHLVPYYGVVDGLQPLFGDGPPMLHIERGFVRSAFIGPAFWAIATALSVLLLTIKADRERGGACEWGLAAAFLAISLFLDTNLLDSGLSQISPLQSLSRVLPSLFFVSLAPLVLAAIVVLAGAASSETITAAIVMVAGVCFPMIGHAPLRSGQERALFEQIAALSNSKERQAFERIVQSPSFWLLREYGIQAVRDARERSKLVFESASTFPLRLAASSGGERLGGLKDSSDSTAWSTLQGKQLGNEWVNFIFDEPMRLGGMRLETGRYFTDFPRGVEVRVADRCTADDRDFASYRPVHSRIDNQGDILLNGEGYPYFAEQYNISLGFPPDTIVQCVLVRQIGVERNFDWSISEAFFARG